MNNDFWQEKVVLRGKNLSAEAIHSGLFSKGIIVFILIMIGVGRIYSSSNSTGQWSLPKISVCILASTSRSLSRSEMRK